MPIFGHPNHDFYELHPYTYTLYYTGVEYKKSILLSKNNLKLYTSYNLCTHANSDLSLKNITNKNRNILTPPSVLRGWRFVYDDIVNYIYYAIKVFFYHHRCFEKKIQNILLNNFFGN